MEQGHDYELVLDKSFLNVVDELGHEVPKIILN